jgi:hypothetical protein
MRDTIEIAREAGFPFNKYGLLQGDDDGEIDADKMFKAFEALVRADEREETNRRANASWTLMCEKMVAAERELCAKVCDELPAPDVYSDTDKSMWDVTCMDCAAAIRERGTHD